MPTIRPERAVASLAILTGWLLVVVDGDDGKSPVRKSAAAKSFRMGVRTPTRKVDCPIVGKDQPIKSESFLPWPRCATPSFPPPLVNPNPISAARSHSQVLLVETGCRRCSVNHLLVAKNAVLHSLSPCVLCKNIRLFVASTLHLLVQSSHSTEPCPMDLMYDTSATHMRHACL